MRGLRGLGIQGLANPVFSAGCPGGGLMSTILSYNPILYMPLNELSGIAAINYGSLGTAANGTYSGPTLAQMVAPGGGLAPLFDGANDFVNTYSAVLDAAFNGRLGSILVFSKVFNVGVWADGAQRNSFRVADDVNNQISLIKSPIASTSQCQYSANGIIDLSTLTPHNTTNWFLSTCTFSFVADQMKHYVDNALVSTETGLGAFTAGAGDAARNLIGAATTASIYPYYGYLCHAAIFPVVLTQPDIANIWAAGGV